MRTSIARIGLAAVAVLGFALVGSTPAGANTSASTSTTGSIWEFTRGGTLYYLNHNGDDFGIDVTSGIAIDARWESCKRDGGTGAIQLNISAPGARRVLGTNFLTGTCLRVQYRGYTKTGTFSSTQYWNYSFA